MSETIGLGTGKFAVSARVGPRNCLYFKLLEETKEVGEHISFDMGYDLPTPEEEDPDVIIDFANLESLDVVIDQLFKIRLFMRCGLVLQPMEQDRPK